MQRGDAEEGPESRSLTVSEWKRDSDHDEYQDENSVFVCVRARQGAMSGEATGKPA